MKVRKATRAEVAAILGRADAFSVQKQTHESAYVGCDFWKVEQGGAIVFAWAGRLIGDEFVIIAAASAEGVEGDWTVIGFDLIERHAPACETIAFQTSRLGLVVRAESLDYKVEGYILRKKK